MGYRVHWIAEFTLLLVSHYFTLSVLFVIGILSIKYSPRIEKLKRMLINHIYISYLSITSI